MPRGPEADGGACASRALECPVRGTVRVELPNGERLELVHEGDQPTLLPAHRLWWFAPEEAAFREPKRTFSQLAGQGLLGLDARAGLDLAWLSHLERLPQLVGLSLIRTGPGAAEVDRVARLPRLSELDLSSCRMETADLAPLANAGRLTRLALDKVQGAKDLSCLRDLPELRRVSLAGVRFTAKRVKSLPKSLTHLNLAETALTPKQLGSVAKHLGALEALSVCLPLGRDEGAALELFAGFPRLEKLVLGTTAVDLPDLGGLRNMSRLRYLDVSLFRLDDPRHLGDLLGLEELVLHDPPQAALEAISCLPALRALTLVNVNTLGVSDLDASALRELPSLTQLTISGWKGSPAELHELVAPLAHLSAIRVQERYDTLDVPLPPNVLWQPRRHPRQFPLHHGIDQSGW